MTIIETHPTQPYFGILPYRIDIAERDVSRELRNLSGNWSVVEGRMPTDVPPDTIRQPVLLGDSAIGQDDCLWRCLTGSPVPEAAVGAAAAIAEGSVPKAWVGLPRGLAGASRFTSVGSILVNRFPETFGQRTPNIMGRLAPVFSAGRIRLVPTPMLWRFIGRWIPGVGWGLMAADLIAIDQCVANCRGERSILRALCEELTPFCPKPAW